ncbi:hypothetical protein ACF0H5_020296 [Mactra antiquata]
MASRTSYDVTTTSAIPTVSGTMSSGHREMETKLGIRGFEDPDKPLSTIDKIKFGVMVVFLYSAFTVAVVVTGTMNLILIVVLCLVAVSTALHSKVPHEIETKNSGHTHDIIEVGAIHRIKDNRVDLVPHDNHGDVPHAHPVVPNDKLKPVDLKPELEPVKPIKNKPKRKRFNNRPKLITNVKKPGKGQRKNNKRINRRKLNGKRLNKRKNRRPFKRQMRKLPTGSRKSIIERIMAENKSGKGSKLSTKYLKEKIRALLKDQGIVESKPCKTDKKIKANRVNKRKFMRKLTPKKGNRTKKRLLANRKKVGNKGRNGLKKKRVNRKKNMPKKIPATP